MLSINKLCTRAACMLALLFTVLYGNAQEFRAVLTGQVTDPPGAVLKGAKVTAVNAESGTTYTGQTTDKGVYYIPYVLPGDYTVTAEASGFKTAVQDKVLLLASQTFNQNFKLEVGSVAEHVEVSATPPQLETSTGSGGTVIDQRALEGVPLNGGQAYMLIGTTPGSQFTTTSFGPGVGNSGTRGWDVTNSYTIGGGISGNNQFTLNGVNITSQTGYGNHSPGEWTVSPNIDSIQEVNVMTTTYDARFGRTSGGTVNVVSKAGGDQYHGDVRYAYEGGFMNANNFTNNLTGTPRQGEVQNQFWITAGGPIIKKKLFFFFGFEGYRQSIASTLLTNVPPAFLRPGYNGDAGVDFALVQQMDPSEFPNGLPIYQPGTAYCLDGGPVTACNSNHVAQLPFANNTIPGPQISPVAAGVLKYIPLPNIPGTQNLVRGNNFLGHNPDLYDYNQPQIRVDYNLSDKTKLYSYFLYWHGTEFRSNNALSGVAANGNINWVHQNWVASQDVTTSSRRACWAISKYRSTVSWSPRRMAIFPSRPTRAPSHWPCRFLPRQPPTTCRSSPSATVGAPASLAIGPSSETNPTWMSPTTSLSMPTSPRPWGRTLWNSEARSTNFSMAIQATSAMRMAISASVPDSRNTIRITRTAILRLQPRATQIPAHRMRRTAPLWLRSI
jgi:hypothetical protein